MDLLDRAKITDVFVNDFKKAVSLGDQSPPRKQFVEKEVQTDESVFGRFVKHIRLFKKNTVVVASAPTVARR